jgi:hypothetical protein
VAGRWSRLCALTAQVAELKAAECRRVFQEKIGGARSDRKQLARLLAGTCRQPVEIVGTHVIVRGFPRAARGSRASALANPEQAKANRSGG